MAPRPAARAKARGSRAAGGKVVRIRSVKGSRLGHYKVLDLLGAGGMGEVYVAEDTSLKRRVALKVLPPGVASRGDRLHRFRVEAEALAALSHPAIVTIFSIESAETEPDGRPGAAPSEPVHFLTMELVEGRQLDRVIPEGGLAVGDFYRLACRVVEGVAAAHARGVIHRDLKPANILVTPEGRPKILDFGLAKLREGAGRSATDSALPTALATVPGQVLGTPAYMAPEQAAGGVADARTDLFALGAVFYEMLTGRRPFEGDSPASFQAAVLTAEPRPPRELRPEIPRRLEQLVERCLQKDPAARYATAEELLAELREQAELHLPGSVVRERRLRKRVLLPAVAVVLAMAAVLAWTVVRGRRVDRARREAVPRIEQLLADQRTVEAFELAAATRELLPEDPVLADLLGRASKPLSVTSEPLGAEVWYQEYRAPGDGWQRLGTTPIHDRLVPHRFLRFRVEKPGYGTLESGAEADIRRQHFVLRTDGETPEGMAWVPPGVYGLGGAPVTVPGFWLDRHEVTNRQYQEFVDAGGYAERRYWQEPLELDGRRLEWREATARFVDTTDRPGPATWSLGRFPEGRDDYPVRGVSWYEAAAFAVFAGKSLPTLFHWRRGAPWSHYGDLLLLSNFESDGARPVGGAGAVGRYGHLDMAGNVSEWCWNRAPGGRRYLLGGSWLEPSYVFTHNNARSPFERQADFGFRLARFDQPPAPELAVEVGAFRHDFTGVEPVPDQQFAFYRSLFDYAPLPIEPTVEPLEETQLWRGETVTLTAAYGSEQLLIHVFLPNNVPPPYQTVVYMPSSGVRMFASIRDMWSDPAFFVPRSGRALVWPVYKNSLERGGGEVGSPRSARETREEIIQRVNDLQRTVDYLQTRDDVRSDRLAYLGLSYGGEYGPVYLAMEPRFKTAVLLAGGFDDLHMLGEPPETNPWNYAPRVRTPVLMVNGASDYGLPVDTAQRPMFELLGSPSEDKRHVLLAGGHLPYDWNAVYRETLAWLDRYLGPVDYR